MTNRVLMYLGDGCQCRRVKRLIDRATEVAEEIEATAGDDVFEFWMPSVESVINDGFQMEILFRRKLEPVTTLDGIEQHVCGELRRAAKRLADAADRIEGVKGGAA